MSKVIEISQKFKSKEAQESPISKNPFYNALDEFNHTWIRKAMQCSDQEFAEYSAEFILFLYRTAHLAFQEQDFKIKYLEEEIRILKEGGEING
jgi:hypothetical protein